MRLCRFRPFQIWIYHSNQRLVRRDPRMSATRCLISSLVWKKVRILLGNAHRLDTHTHTTASLHCGSPAQCKDRCMLTIFSVCSQASATFRKQVQYSTLLSQALFNSPLMQSLRSFPVFCNLGRESTECRKHINNTPGGL